MTSTIDTLTRDLAQTVEELASLTAQLNEIKQQLAAAHHRKVMITRKLLTHQVEEVMAKLDDARREYERLTGDLLKTRLPYDATDEQCEAFEAQLRAISQAERDFQQCLNEAYHANSWTWDTPAFMRYEKVMSRDWDNDGWEVLAFTRSLARSTRDDLKTLFREAIDDIWRHGSRGLNLPCSNCGGPRSGYDDQDYYCPTC